STNATSISVVLPDPAQGVPRLLPSCEPRDRRWREGMSVPGYASRAQSICRLTSVLEILYQEKISLRPSGIVLRCATLSIQAFSARSSRQYDTSSITPGRV